jgi:hypothetical protein
LNRILINCSSETDFIENKALFFSRLLARDYTTEFLQPIFDAPRNRENLLSKIRTNQRNKLNHILKENNSTQMKFITTYNQETTQLNIKQCLKLTEEMRQDPHCDEVFGKSDPIICYKTSKKLGQILTSTQYKHQIQSAVPTAINIIT